MKHSRKYQFSLLELHSTGLKEIALMEGMFAHEILFKIFIKYFIITFVKKQQRRECKVIFPIGEKEEHNLEISSRINNNLLKIRRIKTNHQSRRIFPLMQGFL